MSAQGYRPDYAVESRVFGYYPCNYCCWLCIKCVHLKINQASLALSQRFDSSPWVVSEDVLEGWPTWSWTSASTLGWVKEPPQFRETGFPLEKFPLETSG